MRILVLNGGTGTVKAALATTQGKRVVVDGEVEAAITRLIPLAPLHNEESLIAAEVARMLGGTV